MGDLELHNLNFRKSKEVNKGGLRRAGGVLAHLFKEKHLVKELEEAFCPA